MSRYSDRLYTPSPHLPSSSPNLKRGESQMPLAELMSQIKKLSKIDKLRLMQFLSTKLINEAANVRDDANEFSDLVTASSSSLDFWDNSIDDAKWNNVA
jgi:hypothetical protein